MCTSKISTTPSPSTVHDTQGKERHCTREDHKFWVAILIFEEFKKRYYGADDSEFFLSFCHESHVIEITKTARAKYGAVRWEGLKGLRILCGNEYQQNSILRNLFSGSLSHLSFEVFERVFPIACKKSPDIESKKKSIKDLASASAEPSDFSSDEEGPEMTNAESLVAQIQLPAWRAFFEKIPTYNDRLKEISEKDPNAHDRWLGEALYDLLTSDDYDTRPNFFDGASLFVGLSPVTLFRIFQKCYLGEERQKGLAGDLVCSRVWKESSEHIPKAEVMLWMDQMKTEGPEGCLEALTWNNPSTYSLPKWEDFGPVLRKGLFSLYQHFCRKDKLVKANYILNCQIRESAQDDTFETDAAFAASLETWLKEMITDDNNEGIETLCNSIRTLFSEILFNGYRTAYKLGWGKGEFGRIFFTLLLFIPIEHINPLLVEACKEGFEKTPEASIESNRKEAHKKLGVFLLKCSFTFSNEAFMKAWEIMLDCGDLEEDLVQAAIRYLCSKKASSELREDARELFEEKIGKISTLGEIQSQSDIKIP